MPNEDYNGLNMENGFPGKGTIFAETFLSYRALPYWIVILKTS